MNNTVQKLKDFSDERLEDIIRDEYENTAGSRAHGAQIELELRRKRRVYEHQQKILEIQGKIYSTAKKKLDHIIKLLDKPKCVAFWISIWGLIIAVAINVFTAFVCSWLHCPVSK